MRLFDRSARAVALTDEGRRFFERVAPLLAGVEEAAIEAAGSSAEVRGRLRVNLDATFARLVLGPRLEQFLAAYPSLSLELAIRHQLGDLVAEGFDAAVRFGDPEPSALVARLLLKTRILTCASPAYLKRRGRPTQPAYLGAGRHECILFRDPATGRPFPWEFHRGKKIQEVTVSGRLVLNDYGTLLAACTAGHGVAQVMELGARALIGDGVLVVLFPDWSDERFPLYALHRRGICRPRRCGRFSTSSWRPRVERGVSRRPAGLGYSISAVKRIAARPIGTAVMACRHQYNRATRPKNALSSPLGRSVD